MTTSLKATLIKNFIRDRKGRNFSLCQTVQCQLTFMPSMIKKLILKTMQAYKALITS